MLFNKFLTANRSSRSELGIKRFITQVLEELLNLTGLVHIRQDVVEVAVTRSHADLVEFLFDVVESVHGVARCPVS